MSEELGAEDPSEAQRVRRRDRRRVTRMVVDGAGIRRQAQALRLRADRRRRAAVPPGAAGEGPDPPL